MAYGQNKFTLVPVPAVRECDRRLRPIALGLWIAASALPPRNDGVWEEANFTLRVTLQQRVYTQQDENQHGQ